MTDPACYNTFFVDVPEIILEPDESATSDKAKAAYGKKWNTLTACLGKLNVSAEAPINKSELRIAVEKILIKWVEMMNKAKNELAKEKSEKKAEKQAEKKPKKNKK